MRDVRNTFTKSRRGHVAIEYSTTLIVVASMSAAIAYSQASLFAPFQAADKVFVADSGMELRPQATIPIDVPRPIHERILPATIAALTGIGLATLFCVRLVLRQPIDHDANVDDPVDLASTVQPDPQAELRNMLYGKRNALLSAMTKDFRNVIEGDFEVSHLMSTTMKTCETDTPAVDVRKRMRDNNMHHLLVCDGPKLVGVISDRDLTKSYAPRAFELMTRNPITVSPSHLLIPTISTMINKRISCLPVTEDGELKGVLTRLDMLVAFQCLLQAMTKVNNGIEQTVNASGSAVGSE